MELEKNTEDPVLEKKKNDISKYSTFRRDVYAWWMELISKTGLIILLVTFFLYATGAFDAYVKIYDLPSLWSQSSSEYMKQTGYHGGWSWLALINKADFMCFIGIALLASASLICSLRILPILLKENDRILAGICLLQILVIILAASGILSAGH